MPESLHILILEDNPADAELIQFELQEAGFIFASKVVMTEEDFVRELQKFSPDLILSDYDLPRYNGARALTEARKRRPDTPFILVTGAVSEDRAIEILTQGAKDYVLKNRLRQRLVPAVKRALAEAEEHRVRKQAEAELREAHRTLEERVKNRTAELESEMAAHKKTEASLRDSEERQRLVLQASSIGTFEVDLLTGEGQWNATEFELLGLKPGDIKASPDTFFRFVHPDDIEQLQDQWTEAMRSGKLDAEFRIVRADGRECWLAGKGAFIFDGHGTGPGGKPLRFMGVNFDITGRKQAEETVAAAQRQIQSIIDNTTAIIYTLDLEERFLLVNTALAELLNSTPEKMIGRRRHDFMPKQDADWHEANDRRVIEAGKALEFEEYSGLPDHSITWLTIKFPLRDPQGRIYAVGGISTDVTKRKKAEEAIRASEERFHGLFTTMDESFVLCEVLTDEGGRPADFRYQDVNPAGERFFGRPREEIVGRTYREIGGTKADAEWIAMLGNVALTGQPASLERHAPVGGRWVDLRAYSPRPGQFAAVFADITERKQAEEALHESEGRFRALTETSSLAVGVSSSDGKFLYINKAYEKLFGYTQKELNHLNASELWRNPEDRRKMIDLVKSKGFLMDYEIELKHKDGTPFWAMLSVNPVDYDGNQAIMASVYDITARKQAEGKLKERTQQLEDANKELESFSYSVSHDLKAPLRAIDGFSRMLLKKDVDKLSDDAVRKLDAIRSITGKMNVLIDDLLSFSKVLKSSIAISEINMNKLVKEVWAEIKTSNTERKLELKIANMLPGKGDPTLIRQVLVNLLSNAAKFTKTKKPGLIEISSYSENGNVVYCIKDNGVGFDMSYYDKLFGVFQRLHSHDEYDGTGVGLAIVHRIIVRHGGRIWAEGEVDKGATFCFTLPTL